MCLLLLLMESGKTIHRFSEKFGLENPVVVDIVQTDKYPAILLTDRGADKVKLVLYKSGAITKPRETDINTTTIEQLEN